MYRFLIIDDEPVVREGISNTIDWKNHGFELVGACRDGREGMDAVERLRPDVVLTDICMPFVDGIELAASISEQFPSTRTILLTGHDEFEYAQEAVRLNVTDYLLKPITAAEFRDVLDAVKIELDLERDHQAKLKKLNTQVRESLSLYRERFLNRLVRAVIPHDEIVRSVEFLELDLSGPTYTAFIVDTDAPATDLPGESADISSERLFALAVQEIVLDVVGNTPDTVAFATPGEATAGIVSTDFTDNGQNRALEIGESISARVQREFLRTVTVGIGESVSDLHDVHHSYEDAQSAVECRFVLGGNQVVTIRQARGEADRPVSELSATPREEFLRVVKTGPEDSIREALSATFDVFRSLSDDLERCYVAVHRLLADTISALESVGVEYGRVASFQGNPFAVLGRIKTLDDIEAWFFRFILESQDVLNQRRQRHSQRKAIEAVEYIDAHFTDPALSLQQVCSALAVSKSYLSPVFKAHTDKTFVEYLTEVRSERAKALMSDPAMKIYEVAEQVGFRNAHYFSLTFKKQTGYTPSEYQESIGRGAG